MNRLHASIPPRRAGHFIRFKHCWWIFLFLFTAVAASALEVPEVKWGFDGQVVPGQFNLLSVFVANPAAKPFDGAVNLYKSRGLADRVGALYQTPCYLTPQSGRWLQFYVFIENEYDQWQLEWGRAPDQRHEIPAPKLGVPAQVLLTGPEAALHVASAFKEFPEELFPPTIAATHGLRSVLLDHAPRWEAPKRRAFLDWLHAGGKVHLLLGADGRPPTFSDDLNELNFSGDNARLGAGTVVRHAATARDLHAKDVPDEEAPVKADKKNGMGQQFEPTDNFLQALARFSQRQYSWGGIYALAILYAALVGPGNWLWGRKLADYRLRIALLLVTIAVFAFLFNLVGRRGQGEASQIHSLSYARAIDGDNYDVMQWVNAFAARGANYTITHPAPHNLYATGQDYETVNGLIANGKDGKFLVDLPMFSRRAFLHAAEMKGDHIPVQIVKWFGAEKFNQLIVSVGPEFRKKVLDGWAVQGGQIYHLKSVVDGFEFGTAGSDTIEIFSQSASMQLNTMGFGGNDEVQPAVTEARFQKMTRSLLVWSLGPRNVSKPADGHAQLFLVAHSPESFNVTGSVLGRETGYVLYEFNLSKPIAAGSP